MFITFEKLNGRRRCKTASRAGLAIVPGRVKAKTSAPRPTSTPPSAALTRPGVCSLARPEGTRQRVAAFGRKGDVGTVWAAPAGRATSPPHRVSSTSLRLGNLMDQRSWPCSRFEGTVVASLVEPVYLWIVEHRIGGLLPWGKPLQCF